MVETFRGNKVFSVACGEHHTIASAESGAYSWGWNGSGQLGIGSQEDHHSPQLIQALEGATIQQIACGSAHSIAIISNDFFFQNSTC